MAAVILGVALVLGRRTPRLRPSEWGTIIMLGLVGNTLFQLCIVGGLAYTTPAHSALILALNPLVTVVLAAAWLGERLGPRRAGGIALALGGVATIVLRDGALAGGPLVGDLLTLGAACAWAVYSVLGKPLLATRPPFEVTALAMVVGAVALLPLGLPGLVAVPWTHLGVSTWLLLGYISVLTQVVAYLLWYWTLARAPTARVVAFTYLTPVIATAISVATGHEVVSGALIAGALAVLIGVALAQLR